eukprot:jgi/Hompol1/2129/HPOL_005858-RA
MIHRNHDYNADLNWYNKGEPGSISASVQRSEIEEIKEREAEALAEALGGHVRRKVDPKLSAQDIKQLIPKDIGAAEDEDIKISGLGFG